MSRHMKQHKNKQSGAVMVTVLLLLVVVTLMGLSAMKQGMLQARMGAAEVAYNSCFMAAESGLNAVYRNFQTQSFNGNTLNKEGSQNHLKIAYEGDVVKHCLGDGGFTLMTGTACPTGQLTVYGEMAVTMRSRPADSSNSTEKDSVDTFNTEVYRGDIIQIYTDARCEIDAADLAVVNTQAWQHKVSNSLTRLPHTGR